MTHEPHLPSGPGDLLILLLGVLKEKTILLSHREPEDMTSFFVCPNINFLSVPPDSISQDAVSKCCCYGTTYSWFKCGAW